MSTPASAISGPLTWRSISQIPGLIPVSSLEIRDDKREADSAERSQIDGRLVSIRWKKQTGLEWHEYLAVKVARVYGETFVLLEKSDESRSWAALRDIALIRTDSTSTS